MNVTLLHYNPEALDLLIFTKQTRLTPSVGLLDDIRAWPMEKKLAELNYMLGTIESSWEFADYVFLIDGVSRAFTHQLVRTREASYAQQSQRTVDMSGFDYVTPRSWGLRLLNSKRDHPKSTDELPENIQERAYAYVEGMYEINEIYEHLVELGVPPQDARGVLPTNVATNIIMKANLRTLSHMARLRLCTRTQGEYQDVFRLMRERVVEVHPWAEPFLRVHCAATGVCAFPHYKECPIKGPVFNPDTGHRWDEEVESRIFVLKARQGGITTWKQAKEYGEDIAWAAKPATREEIQVLWENLRYEAIPKQAPPASSGASPL